MVILSMTTIRICASSPSLVAQELLQRHCMHQMDRLENLACRTNICATKDRGEIQRHRRAVANRCGRQRIRESVKAEIGGRVVGRSDGVVLKVWSMDRFLIRLNGFDESEAEVVECSGCADCVVRSIQSGCGDAVPGDVGEGADDGEDLRVGVRDGVEDFIAAGGVALAASGW